jgi:tetratricopeptide (TPR) repeat protein
VRRGKALVVVGALLISATAACSSPQPSRDPSVLIGAAMAAQKQGNTSAALQLLGQAITADPRNANAFFDRGVIEQHLGQTQPALNDYAAALRAAPQDVAAMYNEATIYAGQDPQKAISLYHQVVTLSSGNAAAWLNLGLLLAQDHQRPAAIASLAHAVRLRPSYASRVPSRLRTAVGDAAHHVSKK